ncbi:DUF58 domain-containing protein [Crocinitomicaceae bacterium CZZ-1]|uniref:DUF58 domain-containing protein n=1 Tax=Taishania pollutisoli TaxID=2766479 RepID=A0A8J6TTS1_9FLAO|nr:DUF58 domain-containing protein [Taishania pollutisoli]MBC9813269.1 DUF58 domain-containing protein [Taishania pollutisoli]
MATKTIDRLRLAQFGNLELLAKQVVEGFITGMHKSPFHGFSVEFAEHRLYNKGESTRHIDWKLYGKTEKLFTKKYEEETNLRCQIVIDCSGSMFFPKDGTINKYEYSTYAAASLIELLKRQRDAVGLSLFSDHLELHTQSKSSPAHHRFLYSELEKHLTEYTEQQQKTSDTITALHSVAELCHRRSLIIIFTDFIDNPSKIEELFHALQHLKHNKHEVIVFHVVQKKTEIDFELENRPYYLVDMETGEKMKVQPAELKANYSQRVAAYFEDLKMRMINNKIDFVQVDIDQGYDQVLLSYLLKRQNLY